MTRPPDLQTVVDRLNDVLQAQTSAGDLPLGNKRDPYDELIYILLTVMTRSQPRLDQAYDGLKDLVRDGGWSQLSEIDELALREVLRPLGFVNRRYEQLVGIARRVEADHGGTLEPLRHMSDEDALNYLLSLPGVGVKTAKCVLMYSLHRDVLPIDIHVLRVGKRLGLVPEGASWSRADELLEATVPDTLKYAVHVGFVVHGRNTCRSRNPDCPVCPLEDLCPSAGDTPRLRRDFTG